MVFPSVAGNDPVVRKPVAWSHSALGDGLKEAPIIRYLRNNKKLVPKYQLRKRFFYTFQCGLELYKHNVYVYGAAYYVNANINILIREEEKGVLSK